MALTTLQIGGIVVCAIILFLVALLGICKLYIVLRKRPVASPEKMNGKIVIVTGANSGIGKETAKELARRGAKVIMACRNLDVADQVREEIVKETKNQNVLVKKLDLSSLDSVRSFAADINKTETKLDVLIHNAGVAYTFQKVVTKDGLDMTMGTNHFGPFLLTHLLIGITVNCLHPGMIDSGIWRNVPFPLSLFLLPLTKVIFKTPEEGCQTTVNCAVAPELEKITGKYFMDCEVHELANYVKDPAKAKKVWELSEALVKLQNTDPRI
ncbi:hypothetical protein RUM44_001788 [Polyplax serrata]|uniref:Retinol dehydrogenase 11 n=1 Tax=Polyplax serrata TaxID=468196 RepID=A0ABR1AL42_POLSC